MFYLSILLISSFRIYSLIIKISSLSIYCLPHVGVDLWLEYIQFSIGDISKDGGLERIRTVAERALTAVGLDVSRGALIFEAYRELENAVLAGLQVNSCKVIKPKRITRLWKIKTKKKKMVYRIGCLEKIL